MTGRKFRLRSIDDVVEEIRFVQTAFPNVKSIFLEDDTLTVNKSRLVAFSEALIKKRCAPSRLSPIHDRP